MFDEFLKKLGLTESEFNMLLTVLGLLLTLLIAIIPPLRRLFSRVFYKILSLLGFTHSVYRKRFLERHSKLHNIYLDKIETLDLRATYIPLHLDMPGYVGRMPAVELLADRNQRRLVIVGDPGTGKTTLLKAYGTGILRPFSGLRLHDSLLVKQLRETPILIDLRHFATNEFAEYSLPKYIVDHVFKNQLKVKNGEPFLQSLLSKGRCLLLLDGLDEVSEEQYERVRTRISAFCNGQIPDFDTHKARVIMSCRKQNFERLRADWIPQTFREVVSLVPFNMDEVFHFLSHRKSEFRDGRSPDAFFNQIKASSMAELHRNPLLLTISLGLYLNTPQYEIPNSVAQFYETIILHLLRRHDFQTDPHVKKVNKFNAEDKYRFLREFALKVAERGESFDEFSYREILGFFEMVHQSMTNVAQQDARAFIREIVNHSGLLTRISDDDVYIFAHRSIHEYFIAVQLARSPRAGMERLLEKANNMHWRQVIVFFASLDHAEVEPFLKELMRQNLELAGYCVPSAQILSPELAENLAEALVEDIRKGRVAVSLPALISMTKSYRTPIRTIAMQHLKTVLGEVFDTESYQLSGLKEEDVPELLGQLANTRSLDVIPTCLRLSEMVPNPKDAIGPLWQCLTIPELKKEQILASQIVRHLLDNVMDPEGLVELQHQPAFAPDFATPKMREEVYPFSRGHSLDSNLVTLLAWTEKTGAVPSKINYFFEAKQEQPEAWRRVERERSRFTLKIHWYSVFLILSTLTMLIPLIYVISFSFLQGWEGFFLPGQGKWVVLWGAITFYGVTLIEHKFDFTKFYHFWFYYSKIKKEWLPNYFQEYSKFLHFYPSYREYMFYPLFILWIKEKLYVKPNLKWLVDWYYWIHLLLIIPLFVKKEFINSTTIVFILALFIWYSFFIVFPGQILLEKKDFTYLQTPNPVINIYDDPRSKHWVEPEQI